MTLSPAAQQLIDSTRERLSETEQAIRTHSFLSELEAGRISEGQLDLFARSQHHIISSDRRSFAFLATRFPEGAAGELFLSLAAGEGIAMKALKGFESWTTTKVGASELTNPLLGCITYPAVVGWMALNGSRSDVALSFYVNLSAWGFNCGRMAEALRSNYGASEDATAFLEFFAAPVPELENTLLAALEEGLEKEDPPGQAQNAARLLQESELLFWNTLLQQ